MQAILPRRDVLNPIPAPSGGRYRLTLLLSTQMDDNVDCRDFVSRQRLRQRLYQDPGFWHIKQPIFLIDEEMVVSGRVGIEK
jgi:hypothetical protein